MTSQEHLVNHKLLALALVAIGGLFVSVAAQDGTLLATVGRFTGVGVMLLFGASLVWRSYRLNVVEVTQRGRVADERGRTAGSEPANEQETGGWLGQTAGPEWFMRYTSTDFKLFWTWVLVAVFPFLFQWGGHVRLPGQVTVPFPWYAFPISAVAGIYVSHRVFVGPLTTDAGGDGVHTD